MSEVKRLEKQVEDCRELMEKREMALRLHSNPDFKKLILDGFCLQDCARFAQNSQNPALNAEQQKDSLHMAQAAGHLRRYMSTTIQMANAAENSLQELEEAIVEARAEEEGG